MADRVFLLDTQLCGLYHRQHWSGYRGHRTEYGPILSATSGTPEREHLASGEVDDYLGSTRPALLYARKVKLGMSMRLRGSTSILRR